NNVSNDFSKPVTAQTLPTNKKPCLKNTNVLAPGMYKLHIDHTRTRTSQLPQDSKNTNKRASFSTGVIPTTSVSRPQLKSNLLGDRVMHNNSQGKKKEVEDPRRSLIEIVLFIIDSGCSKHMTRNLKLLINFVEKFLGTVKFRNDKIAPILGYGDLVQGAVTIKRVYYVKGMNHNLFSVGQFCDVDLEVAFRKSTCFIRDLKGNDLLTGSRGSDLYSITLQGTNSPNLICLMAKATSSQAWLWHRRLSHLNFDTINLLSKNDIVTMALEHDSLSPGRQSQENVSHGDKTVTTSNELDLLFSSMYDELLNGSPKVVSKSSVVSAVDALNKRQQLTTPLNNHTTPAPTCQIPSIAPTVISSENINQAGPHAKNDQVADDEFINIFSRYKTKGRHRYVMLIRQICTLSINVILLNIVGQKIILWSKSLGILHNLLELDVN
nr:ribonuclease H-like domain-containing protein [Tanacetum cinerariifolium]